MKLKADDLLNHFEHYFSENSKEFEKILSPENISVKFKFSLGEKKNEKVEFTAQGNKREVQVSKWVVGKVRFYSSEYIKKKDRNENNENAFNPFNIDRIGEEGPMPQLKTPKGDVEYSKKQNGGLGISKQKKQKKKKKEKKDKEEIPFALGLKNQDKIQTYLPPIDTKTIKGDAKTNYPNFNDVKL